MKAANLEKLNDKLNQEPQSGFVLNEEEAATVRKLLEEVERLREIEESWNDAVRRGLIIADEHY